MTAVEATPSLVGTRIVHVVPCLGTGGLELALARLANALQRRGAVQTVVALCGEPEIAARFDAGISIHALRARPRERGFVKRLRQVLIQAQPQVVHCRNWSSWPDTVRARGFLGPRPALVFSFHGTTEPAPMPWKRRLAMRWLARCTTEIFTVSEAARTRLVDEVGLPRQRVGLIPNGIAFEQSVRAVPRKSGDAFIIGSVGNLNPIKNQQLLVRALAQLRAQGVPAEIRIAGEGPQREALTALARELGVQEHFHLIGHVSDVRGFLANLSAFVLCSRLEAHPNALIEAMAAELPCVGTNCGGIPEVLLHGKAGLITADDDDDALATALHQLHNNPAAAAALAQAGRLHCERTYSLDAMVAAYDRLYARLAAPPTPAHLRPTPSCCD